jgi:hypothetical protein
MMLTIYQLDDYLVVNPDSGAVTVYWNRGYDVGWANGWKFEPGGEIASGVPHVNLATLRFPDINGDGRADYVYIGEGGSLGHWLNTGTEAEPMFYSWPKVGLQQVSARKCRT